MPSRCEDQSVEHVVSGLGLRKGSYQRDGLWVLAQVSLRGLVEPASGGHERFGLHALDLRNAKQCLRGRAPIALLDAAHGGCRHSPTHTGRILRQIVLFAECSNHVADFWLGTARCLRHGDPKRIMRGAPLSIPRAAPLWKPRSACDSATPFLPSQKPCIIRAMRQPVYLAPHLETIVSRLVAGGPPEEVPASTLPSEREAMLDRIAAAGARDPNVAVLAQSLADKLAARLGRAPTRSELIQWLMDSVHLLVDYAPDPAGREVFQSVPWTLAFACGTSTSPLTGRRKGCADCEDQAALLCALLMANGIAARVKWLDQPGSPLNHVSAVALIDGARPGDPRAWVCADATIPGARPGETPYQALERVGPGFRSRVFGIEQAAGGVFATSRTSPAGDPVADRMAELGARRDAEAQRWPGYARYLGYSVLRTTETPVPGAALYVYASDPAFVARLPPVADAEDRYFYPDNTAARSHGGVSMGILSDRPGSVPTIAADVPRGPMDGVETAPLNATTRPHDFAVASRFELLRTLDSLTRQIRDLRNARTGVPVGDADPVVGVSVVGPRVGVPDVIDLGSASPVAPASRTLYVVAPPPGSAISIGGAPLDVMTGRWVGSDFSVPIPAAIVSGMREVRVAPPVGDARAVQVPIRPEGQTNVSFALMPVVPRAPSIELVHAIPGSRLFVDGVDVTDAGRWTDAASSAYAVPASPGSRVLRVRAPNGEAREASGLQVPASGSYSVDWNAMTAAPSPSTSPTTFIRVRNAPVAASYAVDGRDVTASVVQPSAASSEALVPAAPGARSLRIVPRAGFARGVDGVTVPSSGGVGVDYTTMLVVDGGALRAIGRVVVRGAPAGISPARVVTPDGVAGDPAQSQPLTPQPGGYLAVVWPVGTVRLQVGSADIPAAVMLGVDSVYDWSGSGLTFRPEILSADAPSGSSATERREVLVTLRAMSGEVEREVTLTGADGVARPMTPQGEPPTAWSVSVAPGNYTVRATSTLGSVRRADIVVGWSPMSLAMDDTLWTVSDSGAIVLSGVPRDPASSTPPLASELGAGAGYVVELTRAGADAIPLRAVDGGRLAAYAPAGRYCLMAYLVSGSNRAAARSLTLDLVDNHITEVSWSSMQDASEARLPPRTTGHSRLNILGVPAGWTLFVDGVRPEGTADLPYGVHEFAFASPDGVVARRVVVLSQPDELIDATYDVSRARQFASGKDGVVNITDDGRRNGYLSDRSVADNARVGWLSPAEERRVVREFDVVGAWRDEKGQVPVALFYRGGGMVVVPMTEQERLGIARFLMSWRGKIHKDGYYGLEYVMPGAAPAAVQGAPQGDPSMPDFLARQVLGDRASLLPGADHFADTVRQGVMYGAPPPGEMV